MLKIFAPKLNVHGHHPQRSSRLVFDLSRYNWLRPFVVQVSKIPQYYDTVYTRRIVQYHNNHFRHLKIFNTRKTSCVPPQLWNDDGTLLAIASSQAPLPGCLESDFAQYGSIEAFRVFPDWQCQLSKFAGVQDRLREWKPGMIDKLTKFTYIE
ncbi:hypothetical protein FB446DRAFT_833432 [Lentinula raphanica]|nr:hypothetical protein FB446DRAFT_833432 [Lentinula raphanica]